MSPTETAATLAGKAEATCRHLLPNGILKDGQWSVGSVSGEKGKSLSVCVQGAKAGQWLDRNPAGAGSGDLIGLWKAVKGVDSQAANKEALAWLGIEDDPLPGYAPSDTWARLQQKMHAGSPEELDALAELRGLPSIAGLTLATNAGHLWFAEVYDDGQEYPAWILTDHSRINAQARRMDGQLWGKSGAKCKTIKGCKASWPVGLAGINGKEVALVEGSPDFLAAWHYIWLKDAQARIIPVAMFGASMNIPPEAATLFAGKRVHAFPHNDADGGGETAMAKWEQQAGVRFERFSLKASGKKDLNELATIAGEPDESGVLPKSIEQMFAAQPSRQEQNLERLAGCRIFDFDEAGSPPPQKGEARPITSYAYPSDDDPNMLLGSDDYLGRGGGLLFVSHAGAGKSSWAMDACMMWALGRAWMGIQSHCPRKALIIQAEDSDRYIGKIFTSFAHVNKLTAEDLALLTKNCIIIRLKGVSGLAFFAALKKLTDQHQPDLVVINPLYLYADGDITRSEFAQPFLLALDAANKAEKWGYILIHHTGKPAARDKSGKRAEIEDWESAYMGFGSSYLANWPRATILLEPVPGAQGRYQIKLGKGGLNAGVTKEVEQGAGFRLEPHTRISIRHSREKMPIAGKDRPVYYWEIDEVVPEEAKSKGGRVSRYKISDYMRFIPPTRATAETAPKLHRTMGGASGIPASSFADLLFRAANDGEIMLAEVQGRGMCYFRKQDASHESRGN